MRTKTAHRGQVRINKRRVVPNTILQAGFDMIGALVTGASSATFASLRLLDVEQDPITDQAVSFSAEPMDDVGTRITASVIVSGQDITSDAHFVELLNSNAVVLARAELPDPIPQGVTVEVERIDEFTRG